MSAEQQELTTNPQLELVLSPVEKKARHLVAVCSEIATLPLTVDHHTETEHLSRLHEALKDNAGSPFIYEYLDRAQLWKCWQSNANPESVLSLPDLVDVDTDRRQYGIYTLEGAKKFELHHLIRIEPSLIESCIIRGEIGKAEEERRFHGRWRQEFRTHFGTTYDSIENLSTIYATRNEQSAWRRRYKEIL